MKRKAKHPSKSHPEGRPPTSEKGGPTGVLARRPDAEPFGADALRPWLLAAVCAMFVARPLFPSESAGPRGDGLPMVMLWLVIAVVWLLGAIGRPTFRLRIGWTDAALGLLILLHTVAAVWGAVQGSPRPALNTLWEWIGYGVSFLLVRQLVTGPKETRAVMAVMVALAVALASYGLYQYAYEMPATRRAYKEDPNGMLQRAGMWFEENSPERKLFEDRLESREPLATFALTNSLAGYLTPWLIVALGIAVGGIPGASRRMTGEGTAAALPKGAVPFSSDEDRRGRPPVDSPAVGRKRRWVLAIVIGLGVLVIGVCLLLTKSRSGYLAALLGVLLVGMFCRSRTLRIGWKIPLATATVVAVLVGVGVAVRGLDVEVLSEASKSLGYRLQYWRSAFQMIGDHPLWGCGPGNFQNDYTFYKLPEASEEVADPHNFLLEVWATAGTPAMLALVAMLAAFAYATIRRSPRSPDDAETIQTPDVVDGRTDRPVFVIAGLVVGFLVAVPIGLMSEAPPGMTILFVGLPAAALMLASLFPWIRSGHMPRLLPAVGVAVLLVNLLAAGGIGFPGVAGTLWLLLALGLNGAECWSPRALPKATSVVGLVATIGLALACYQTAYRPVLESQAALRAAIREPTRGIPLFQQAVKADPWYADAWVQLARVAFDEWRANPSTEALEQFSRYTEAAVRVAPKSSSLWLTAGQRYSEVFSRTGQQDAAQKALLYCRRAVALYPNSAISRASLALALEAVGDEPEFRAQAARALELDSLTPHLDKKLDSKLRKRLLRNSAGEN